MRLLIFILLISACKETESLLKTFSLNAGVDNALSALSAIIDEKSNSDYSKVEKCFNDLAEIECLGGIKTHSIESCMVGNQSLAGSVSYKYSKQECGLFEAKENLVRKIDLKFVNPDGSFLSATTNSHTNYENTEIEGGTQLTKTNEGWNLDLLGLRKMKQTKKRKIVHDFSIRSKGTIKLGKELPRETRLIPKGELIINNNLAKYTILLEMSDLRYSSTCCYPISGKLNLSFSGSLSGKASAIISACGTGKLTKEGKEFDLFFESCE